MSHTYDYYFDDSFVRQNESSSKYFGLSVFIHSCLFIGALFVTVPALQKINEPIIIEFEAIEKLTEKPVVIPPMPARPLQIAESKGDKVKPTRGAKKVSAPAPSAPLLAKDAEVISGPVKKSVVSKSEMATLKTTTSGGVAEKATYAPSQAGVPETLEDIQAPALDFEGVEAAQVGNLGEDAFEEEFKNIDQESAAAIRAEKSAFDNEAQLIADEKEAALQALENENAAQARAMEESLEATRTKNAAAMAQMKASEKAVAEKAAREDADRKAAALAARGSGADGIGRGDTGSNENANAATGNPNAVRSIDQLNQVPGNPKPNYAVEERLRREQGKVVFQAYVTPQGQLTNFRLVSSTGYKNLDGKTLSALRKWKFYPGQQGWVEIPQVWTLKGETEQMPALLRRQVSQR